MSSKYKPQKNQQLGKAFVLNGEPCFFRFGGNALAELEGELGITQSKVIELASASELSIELTRAMLWAGLLHSDPEFTLADAGEALDPYLKDSQSFNKLRTALAEAYTLAWPKIEGEPKNAPAPNSPGTTTEGSAPASV
jgi:hypothetical protein